MQSRLIKLEGDGVSAAYYDFVKDEKVVVGYRHNNEESALKNLNLNVVYNDVSIVLQGEILVENDVYSTRYTPSSPLPEVNYGLWFTMKALTDKVRAFCLGTNNPTHKVKARHKVLLTSSQRKSIEMKGYLCLAQGILTINGVSISEGEIVKLSGKSVNLESGAKNTVVAILEIE